MISLPDRLVAHTPAAGSTTWHYLDDHAREVARLAADFATPFGGQEFASLLGLFHDIGKAHPDFQRYLWTCANEPDRKHPTVDHKAAGAMRVPEQSGLPQVLFGHHGGLSDVGVISTRIRDLLSNDRLRLDTAWERFLDLGLEIPTGMPKFPDWVKRRDPGHEFYLRMLFSCLVDADVLDTEAHWTAQNSATRSADISALAELWTRFETNQSGLVAQAITNGYGDDPVNQVRANVYASCLDKAALKPGFFRLTVPTGGGKTRASTAFALRHALANNLRRVIFAVPFLTITDQTVDVLRGAVGSDRAVLEHHSAIEPLDEEATDDQRFAEKWRQLASENWDASIVVTTTVQLFESLFARKTSRCRKLHNIAASVIILDEFQTIPPELRGPIFDVLKTLVQHFQVSVVLCTATQPVLDTIEAELTANDISVTELAPDPQTAFAILDRVAYEWPAIEEAWSWDRVAEEIGTTDQSLTIVNTIKNAAALFEALDDPDAFHLSTRMCGAHRRDVLAEIRRRLHECQPCRVVSTQLVEAGVDLDFPVVLRAMAPLDRIAQAAGRCNREGRLEGKGRVVVFAPGDGGMPRGAYTHGTDVTAGMLAEDLVDFTNPETFNIYFRRFFADQADDEHKIQSLRQEREFELVADAFRMIDDSTIPVFVRYGDRADDVKRTLMAKSSIKGVSLKDDYRRAQPFVVSFRFYERPRLEHLGLLEEIVPGLWEWKGIYHDKLGVDLSTPIEEGGGRIDPGNLCL